jgi:hypothetical protein
MISLTKKQKKTRPCGGPLLVGFLVYNGREGGKVSNYQFNTGMRMVSKEKKILKYAPLNVI